MLIENCPWLEKNDKLVCFGDSITEAPNGYVSILQERLQPLQITVINAGVGGDKTPTALTRLTTEVIAVRPDAVSIYLGTNDAVIGRGRWADEPIVPPEAYQTNLIWMVHCCRLAGIRKFSICTPAGRLEGEAAAEYGDRIQLYCRAARTAADISRARLVPWDTVSNAAWFRHPGLGGLLLTVDGIHMTASGNDLIATTMLRAWNLDAAELSGGSE